MANLLSTEESRGGYRHRRFSCQQTKVVAVIVVAGCSNKSVVNRRKLWRLSLGHRPLGYPRGRRDCSHDRPAGWLPGPIGFCSYWGAGSLS